MAGLSTAANAFSVVGLADIVFRLGVNTADLYSRYRNASKDILSLVNELQAFVETVAQIRLYLDEYLQSPYTQGGGQTPPLQLFKTLSDCETELQNLKRFAGENEIRPDDGLALQMMKRWRWASQQVHVLKSRERINHLNVNLQTFLILMGRKNEIVLRNELKSTRTDITAAGSTVQQAFHKLEGNLTKNQENTNTLIQTQTTLMSRLLKQSDEHHINIESNIISNQKEANLLSQNQTTLIHQLIKMTNDQNHEIHKQISNLTLEQTEDDDFIFQGDNLGSIVLPLLLMKSDLFKAVKTLQEEGVLKVSRLEAEWILQQVDNLLAKSHEAAARDLKGRGSTRGKRTITSSFGMDRRYYLPKHEQEKIAADQKVSTIDQIARINHMSAISTSSGVLILHSGPSSKHLKRCQDSAEIQVFQLSFFPKLEYSSVNISMLMTTQSGRKMQIPRLIQTFNTIPYSAEIDDVICKDDVRGLEKIFRGGQASPNDRFAIDGINISLFHVAFMFRSVSVCEFLFHEGASASMLNPTISEGFSFNFLSNVWSPLTKDLGKGSLTMLNEIDNALLLSNLAIHYGCDPNIITIPSCGTIIHYFIIAYRKRIAAIELLIDPTFHLTIDKFHDIFCSMVGMGCELEGCDEGGNTALLKACDLPDSNMIAALIDIGANVNATNHYGAGVLQRLLQRLIINYDFEEFIKSEDILYRALGILLANKADPNHLCDFGTSPSDYALGHSRRLEVLWKKAVEHAGYKAFLIDIVLCECGHKNKVMIVASAGLEFDNNSTLPISNMTVDEWLERRYEPNSEVLKCLECMISEGQNAVQEI